MSPGSYVGRQREIVVWDINGSTVYFLDLYRTNKCVVTFEVLSSPEQTEQMTTSRGFCHGPCISHGSFITLTYYTDVSNVISSLSSYLLKVTKIFDVGF